MRALSAARCFSSTEGGSGGLLRDSSGRMVMPACPPMTGTVTSRGSAPSSWATKASARTTSSVVTPNSLEGSNTPWG